MTTLLYTHDACLKHDPGSYHPESPARLRSVLAGLSQPEFAELKRREAPRAALDEVARCHPRPFIEAVLAAVPQRGHTALDPDTVLSPGSGEAALRAVGAVCAAVDAVIAGEGDNAFCAVRPPGHHAEADRAMGFCLFNNVAIGARHAQAQYAIERVALLDFDVHHGQGTQAVVEPDASLFYGSTHQYPLYPGTGFARERGIDGNVVNVPLRPNSGSDEFRAAWSGRILPELDRFAPELLIVSAGFDGHKRDPLAQLRLETEDFRWITEELLSIADRHAGGRVVSALEGGYDLEALAAASAAHVRALMRG
jgi:acetoin utilization deacetylase AcuC-like enzyme